MSAADKSPPDPLEVSLQKEPRVVDDVPCPTCGNRRRFHPDGDHPRSSSDAPKKEPPPPNKMLGECRKCGAQLFSGMWMTDANGWPICDPKHGAKCSSSDASSPVLMTHEMLPWEIRVPKSAVVGDVMSESCRVYVEDGQHWMEERDGSSTPLIILRADRVRIVDDAATNLAESPLSEAPPKYLKCNCVRGWHDGWKCIKCDWWTLPEHASSLPEASQPTPETPTTKWTDGPIIDGEPTLGSAHKWNCARVQVSPECVCTCTLGRSLPEPSPSQPSAGTALIADVVTNENIAAIRAGVVKMLASLEGRTSATADDMRKLLTTFDALASSLATARAERDELHREL